MPLLCPPGIRSFEQIHEITASAKVASLCTNEGLGTTYLEVYNYVLVAQELAAISRAARG